MKLSMDTISVRKKSGIPVGIPEEIVQIVSLDSLYEVVADSSSAFSSVFPLVEMFLEHLTKFSTDQLLKEFLEWIIEEAASCGTLTEYEEDVLQNTSCEIMVKAIKYDILALISNVSLRTEFSKKLQAQKTKKIGGGG